MRVVTSYLIWDMLKVLIGGGHKEKLFGEQFHSWFNQFSTTNKKMPLLEIIGGAQTRPAPVAATGLDFDRLSSV